MNRSESAFLIWNMKYIFGKDLGSLAVSWTGILICSSGICFLMYICPPTICLNSSSGTASTIVKCFFFMISNKNYLSLTLGWLWNDIFNYPNKIPCLIVVMLLFWLQLERNYWQKNSKVTSGREMNFSTTFELSNKIVLLFLMM